MKSKIKKTLTVVIIIILIVGTYAALEIFSVIEFKKPGGPYLVGTFGTEITDSTRKEDALPQQNRFRKLIIQFWYPATNTGGLEKAKYHPSPDYFNHEVNKLFQIPEFMLGRLSKSTTNSLINAPLSMAENKYPLIVFSHGMNGMRFLNTYQMEELASNGYIVASIEHSYTALGTVFKDGSKGGVIPYERMENDSFANALVAKWSADQRFVISYLEKLNGLHGQMFFQKIDTAKIGIMGFSFGGATIANTMVSDQRIKAGVNLDGFYYGGNYKKGFKQPFMELRSVPASPQAVTEEELKQSHLTRARWKYIYFEEWQKRLESYTKEARKEYYSFDVNGADHFSFCDLQLMAPFPKLLSPHTKRVHELTNQYTIAFFDQELKGIKSALLTEHKKILK